MSQAITFIVEPYVNDKKIDYSKYVYVSSNYTAHINDKIAVNTNLNTIQIILPHQNLVSAAQIEILDVGGYFETNNCIINSNGINIMGDSDYNAIIDDSIAIDTSLNSLEILLPNTNLIPSSRIEILDVSGTFGINNAAINANSNLIMDDYDNILLDISNSRLLIIYINNSIGWRILR